MAAISWSSRLQGLRARSLRHYVAYSLLLGALLIALVSPTAFPVIILLPLLAVALVLPTIEGRRLRRLLMVAWISIVLVVLMAWLRLPSLYPAPTGSIIVLVIVIVTTLLLLLWHGQSLYRRRMAREGALRGLERVVAERTLAVRHLLIDIEKRAVVQTRLRTEVEQRTQELAILNEIADVSRTARTVGGAHERLAELVEQLFGAQPGSLWVKPDGQRRLEMIGRWGNVGDEPAFDEDDCWALRTQQDHLMQATAAPDSRMVCAHLRHSGATETLCIPLLAHGETLGLLHLRAGEGGTLATTLPRLAHLAAEQVSLVLASLRFQERLRSQSVSDPLTGLYNQRYMEESLKREIRRATRSRRSLGVIMADVDRLRAFNDRHGYDAGDELLREFAALLQASVRGGDIVCRYGGEEFVLIMPEAPAQVTRQRAEQIRQNVRHLQSQYGLASDEQVTISLGVAMFPEDGVTTEALLRSAHAALTLSQVLGGDNVMTL